MSTSATTFRLSRPDGVELFAKRWLPSGPLRGTVQLVTGMAEYLERYDHVAGALAEAGYVVFGHDHRGQGNTARSAAELGRLGAGDWHRLVDDMRALHDHLAAEQPALPHFMFAHSMGSFLAQTYLYTHPGTQQGVVLQGSESGRFWFWPLMLPISRLGRRFRGVDARSRFVPNLQTLLFNAKIRGRQTDFDWLSTDPRVVSAYVADERCGWTATHGFWLEMASGMLANGKTANLRRIPLDTAILLTSGSLDPTADYGRGVDRLARQYREAGLRDVETRIYPGMRHELHNEPGRDAVLRDLVGWLNRHTPNRHAESPVELPAS